MSRRRSSLRCSSRTPTAGYWHAGAPATITRCTPWPRVGRRTEYDGVLDMTAVADEERIRRGLLRRVREAAAEHRRLPGEFDLAAELGCSRVQLRQALADLDRMQVVRRRQGAATVVDQVGLRLNVRLEEQFEHAELLARLG